MNNIILIREQNYSHYTYSFLKIKLVFQVASGLFVIYQVVDGGVTAANSARVTMLHGNRAELNGLGIEGEQAVRQQFANACEILQGLCGLDGTQHTSDST